MWPALEAGSAQRSLRPPTGAIARGLNAEWQRASHQQESQVSLKRDRSRQAGMNGEQPVESTGFGFAFQSDVGPDGRSLNEENPFVSEEPLQVQNKIDDLTFARWAQLNIQPAKLCSDAVFLRRVYVDMLGTLPTLDEAREFADSPDPMKRSACIDRVLERPEFADYMAMKWCDILRVKAEFPIKLWPNAAQAYHRWIRTSIANNMPYDEFARQLLTASGSNFRTPQVNFYRAIQSKEPPAIAEAVALTFLCERADRWPEYRMEGMSTFFSQVGFKPTGEWKEEIVFFDPRRGNSTISTEPLLAVLPNGAAVQIPAGEDPRRVFADWLVDKRNPWFARAISNRIWYWLLGRGIVDPPDDMRTDNPPSNKALLDHLADELISADYDLRHLYRHILNSHTYQLSSIPQSKSSRAAEEFAFYQTRRLDAEVLIDAICIATGTTETYSSIIPEPFTFLPDNQRAIALPDGSITSSFLEMFGRPTRDTGLESDRNNSFSAAQALHLLNSNHLRNKLKTGPKMRELLQQATASSDPSEILYLAILSRRPTTDERYTVSGLCSSMSGAQDVVWALMNSDEFLFRH
ncbi:MAG: DUF1553 domain-containing protein [Planctomycetales bacterium]|nr:DUF1553 domain-containing protein [Planctomycetales bacterium]